MRRTDSYITKEQFNKLEELRGFGLNKSFLIREALEMLFASEYFINLIKSMREAK